VLAVPVAPLESVDDLRGCADVVICLETPTPFFGVGQWYQDFSQVPDDEVLEAAGRRGAVRSASTPMGCRPRLSR